MRITIKDKLKMCEKHLLENKSYSHISEEYDNYDIGRIKYLVNLYKKHGKEPFVNREGVYRKNTKILLINRVKNGESIRSVSLDFGLIDPGILKDWVHKFDKEGETGINDTHPRTNYLSQDERYKKTIDKKLKEENERLKAEIDYLKKSQSLAQKIEELTTKDKTKVVNELRTKYNLEVLLEITGMSSSVYYYQLNSIKREVNKYEDIEK